MLTRASAGTGALAVALAFGAKAFYSHAGPDQLLWILAPSSWLARAAGGVDLAYEVGGGFISHADRLVVGTACAGVNFLVVAFLALFFAYAGRFAGTRAKLKWLLACIGLAYVATILANGVRIAISARLFSADIYGGVVTPERVHRLAGTVLYYGSLLGLCLAVGAALRAPCRRLVPLVCYLVVSIGVPLVGRVLAGGGAPFAEHALWVVAIALLLTAIALGPGLRADRIQWKM